MSAPSEPVSLSVQDGVERLQSPSAIEDFASLHGVSALIVDFAQQGDELASTSAHSASVAIRSLEALACPSIAIVRARQDGASAALLQHFDIVIERDEELPVLVDACQRRPLAALALVQLLRLSEGLSIHQGLVAESATNMPTLLCHEPPRLLM